MHRNGNKRTLWLINMEEIVTLDVSSYFARYILCLKEGDAILASSELDNDFADYICSLNGLSKDKKWFIKIPRPASGCCMAESILGDEKLSSHIRQSCAGGNWQLESYIETSNCVRLAKKLGMTRRLTRDALVEDGLIFRLNDKAFFKDTAAEMGIEILPGCLARGKEELAAAVGRHKTGGDVKIILKESFSGGGFGNLAGAPDEILKRIDGWYKGGTVLVEPFVKLSDTLGSLVNLEENGPVFAGVDRQIVSGATWQGCYYPYEGSAGVSRGIKDLSMKFAGKFWEMGARGSLNLDWGIYESSGGGQGPAAIESNFRHNGFAYVLELAEKIFGLEGDKAKIIYLNRFDFGIKNLEFGRALDLLRRVKINGRQVLAESGEFSEGAVITSPVKDGKAGLLIVSADSGYNQLALERIKKL